MQIYNEASLDSFFSFSGKPDITCNMHTFGEYIGLVTMQSDSRIKIVAVLPSAVRRTPLSIKVTWVWWSFDAVGGEKIKSGRKKAKVKKSKISKKMRETTSFL